VAPVLAAILLMVASPRRHPLPGPLPSRERRVGSRIRDVVDVFRVVGPLLSAVVVAQLLYAALNAFLAIYLVDVREFSPAMAIVVAAIPPVGSLVGAPLGGWLSDRWGRRPVIVVSLIGLGPALLVMTMVTPLLMYPRLVA